jgi:hypothetical protein
VCAHTIHFFLSLHSVFFSALLTFQLWGSQPHYPRPSPFFWRNLLAWHPWRLWPGLSTLCCVTLGKHHVLPLDLLASERGSLDHVISELGAKPHSQLQARADVCWWLSEGTERGGGGSECVWRGELVGGGRGGQRTWGAAGPEQKNPLACIFSLWRYINRNLEPAQCSPECESSLRCS